jgi:GNAT superfamily N-acetyltransferase
VSPLGQVPHPTTTIHAEVLPGTLVDWRRVLAKHYKHLGRASRLQRFLTVMPNTSLQALADRASPDIVLGVDAEGRVIGVLEVFKGLGNHAEIGISVEDAFQGQGFGTALFLDGLVAAEKIGVRTADLYFSSGNNGIRSLVHAVGGQVVQHGPDCEAHIDVTSCSQSADARPDGPPAGPKQRADDPKLHQGRAPFDIATKLTGNQSRSVMAWPTGSRFVITALVLAVG